VSAPNKIPVIYLAGNGRSGSTLLDLVLGRVHGCFSLGEMVWIWSRGFRENQLCGCGAPFGDCAFWSAVRRGAFPNDEEVPAVSEMLRLHRRVVRRRHIPRMVSGRGGRDYHAAFDRYTGHLGRLYRAIHEESGRRVLIDSSKSPVYLYALDRVPEVELWVVHLVRDPRAVAHSWSRKKLRPEIHWERRYMPRYTLRKSARDWTRNNIAAQLYRFVGPRYRRIRYEDFVREPRATLEPLLSDVGLPPGSVDFLGDDGRVETAVTHTVSGNPVRLQKNDVVIREDRRWKAEMPRRGRLLVTALTWPLLRTYGYRVAS
jgi:hypothetical protein